MNRKPSPALLLVAIVLAGVVGYWLGIRRSPPAEITVVACPEIEHCPTPTPPAPRAAATPSTRPDRPKASSRRNGLPALTPIDEPREELLRYVREHADSLSGCVPGTERARLTLQLEVASEGAIRAVKMLDGNDAARRASRCISERLGKWVLPSQWVPQDRTLIVSLVL